jgi:phosphate transport system permease protein
MSGTPPSGSRPRLSPAGRLHLRVRRRLWWSAAKLGTLRTRLRLVLNKAFTVLAVGSVVAIATALVVILAPILMRGASAVVFRGTVEFRRMQVEQFNRGDLADVTAEAAEVARARDSMYAMINEFRRGIDTKDLSDEAHHIHREFGKQLEERGTAQEERAALRAVTAKMRNELDEAFAATDKAVAGEQLHAVLANENDARLKGTVAEGFFALAHKYQHIVDTVDMARQREYTVALGEVQEEMRQVFGPAPGASTPALDKDKYGATRWDIAQEHLKKLLYSSEWVDQGEGSARKLVDTPRERQFAGTDLELLFPMIRENAENILRPQMTFYWQYFIDSGLSGHYFGGVGPEILGTLLLTLVAIVVAMPLGVISAAYLVECAGDSAAVRLIRTCINSLAGVPSIVFGLFGMAFFVIFLLPTLGIANHSSVLAGGLTLALLVLPIVIRSSEEAIRAVPQAYKEAALALGASRLRCFVTVTLPAALPGVLTGMILSVSRAAGETAPLLFTAVAAVAAPSPLWPPWGALTNPTKSLASSSYYIAVQDNTATQVPHNQYGMVMTLVALVLVLNIAAILVRSRVARRLRGQ